MATKIRETYDNNGNVIQLETITYDDAPIIRYQAQVAMDKSDLTMLRIQEAVMAGRTTFAAADIVAWATYRSALRTIISTGFGPLPDQPPYPMGT